MAPLPASTPIEQLPNLGPVSARWLAESGITTLAHLRQMGAITAYALVRKSQGKASLNLLYALHGTLTGRTWTAYALVRKSQGKASLNLLYALHGTLTGRTWKEILAREKEKLKKDLQRFLDENEM